MLLLALALAPAFAIICFIIAKDKYNKEPPHKLLISFLLGIASTLPAIALQLLLRGLLDISLEAQSVLYYAFFAFIAVGFSEEFSKYIMLRYYAYPQREFDEPLDGIVYGVMVSTGFATIENVNYVFQFGYETAIVRMFLSVPAHACFGVIMGYYVGLAKFNKLQRSGFLKTGLWLAVFFHGSFDLFLFLQQHTLVTQYVSASMLGLGSILTLYIALKLSLRAIHLHQELSRIESERRDLADGPPWF